MSKIIRCILIAVVATSMILSAADMLSGTWKLNTAKSNYSPGSVPKSLTVAYSMDGDWVVSKSDSVDAAGKVTSMTNRYKYDGKEYPYKTSTSEGMITVKRIDDSHTEANVKGKSNTTTHGVISKDGTTRTLTTKGTGADGKPVNNVAVYDKQ